MWFPQQLFTSISLCGTRLENLDQGAKTCGVLLSTHAYLNIFKSLNALIAAVLKALLG